MVDGAELGGDACAKATDRAGLGMVEALVCVLLAGVLASIAASAMQPTRSNASVHSDLVAFEAARSKLEELRAAPAGIVNGVDTLKTTELQVVRTWSSRNCDLNGDGQPEPDAYLLHVDAGPVQLETLRTEPGGVGAVKP